MYVVDHQIAGITFRTKLDTHFPGLSLSSRFQRFLVDAINPDVYHRYYRITPASLTLPPLSKERIEHFAQEVHHTRHSLESLLLRAPEVQARFDACVDQPDWTYLELNPSSVAIFDFARRRLDVFYTPDLDKVFVDARVGPFAFVPFLPMFAAAMVHSSGLVRDGVVALFLAPDEGGKTTVVQHSRCGTILCDDQIILRKEGGGIMAHATPWGMITNGPQQARVGGFFLLEKASDFELIPIKPRDVMQFFWNEQLHSWRLLPRHLRIRAFEILYDACHQAPAYRMRFSKDTIDWDAIDAAMVG